MYVCVYLSPAFRFSGRHHTYSITPSFFSNPRLGSSDRQPREGILRWSCQPNHHMAAPHSCSNTRWDPQVWLHPANGAAEPSVSICTCIPLRSALPFFHTAPVACLLPSPVHHIGSLRICLSSLSKSNVHVPVPLLISFSLLLCLLWLSSTQTCPCEKCCLSERYCKMFQTAKRGFWKTFLKWLPEVFSKRWSHFCYLTLRVVSMGFHLVLRCRGFCAVIEIVLPYQCGISNQAN